ncbi:sugar ABC transporter permease [Oceanispirochaeta crateris]|uniref:Sugar ABC transporter permease n=1 Tax=Oceanispirochaeta crateris TaxID=2518645 RepID=A0A5C1QFN6_9SPIO|nr:sugar ABC transporter permease [Oceanispirochaeta crateris]QEN06963.1 sugar ABC transporter permease [Oceanispirochaeta crateris]
MKKTKHQSLWITFFVLPGLLIVLIFIVAPLFLSMFNSLFSWKSIVRDQYVGLENFTRIFTQYPYKDRFYNAIGNNLQWFLSTMLIQNSLGLLFGYLLYKNIAGAAIYQRIFFIPVLFSIVAVGFLWNLYMNPNMGIINRLLKDVGLQSLTRAWLGDEALATPSIIAVNIWRWVGFPTLVFYAGFNTVPLEVVEASYLDGVGEGRLFTKIMFPLILPSVMVITVLTLIGSLNVFEQIYTMTGLEGGPYYSTDTLGTLFYRTAFGGVDSGIPQIGIGSAIGVVIYMLTFVASAISITAFKGKEVQL